MKTLKVAIPLLVVALIAGWYWFRPERLVTNRRVNEAFPAINDSQTQILELGTFHSGTIQPKAAQRSIASRMATEFFGSQTSRHQTALTFTFTWLLPKMRETTQVR
jgi:hypothetical protein